jgi:hypothetical protein
VRVHHVKNGKRIKGAGTLMGRRFILDRTGTFDAMHVYADMLMERGESCFHWEPNIIEWLGFQFLFNRMRPLARFDTPSRAEGMPKLSRNQFAGFLQFLQWSDDESIGTSIIRPARGLWVEDETIPKWEDKGAGRPPIQQTSTPPLTAYDLETLGLFYSDKPVLPRRKWRDWLIKEASVERLVNIVRLCGDAFTEQVTHPENGKIVPIDELVACPLHPKGLTWQTQIWVQTAKGRLPLPMNNHVPRINFPGFEVDEDGDQKDSE